MSREETPAPCQGVAAESRQREIACRAALIATLGLLIFVAVAVPVAIRGIAGTLLGGRKTVLFDLATNSDAPPIVRDPISEYRNSINVAVVSLDPVDGQATLAVSGNRDCAATRATVTLTFPALDDNAARRRGLPPSATLM